MLCVGVPQNHHRHSHHHLHRLPTPDYHHFHLHHLLPSYPQTTMPGCREASRQPHEPSCNPEDGKCEHTSYIHTSRVHMSCVHHQLQRQLPAQPQTTTT